MLQRWSYVIVLIGCTCVTLLALGQNQSAGASIVARLPQPSGKFPLGTRQFEWFDDSPKISANRSRPIMVTIFYPSTARSGKYAEYFRGASLLPLNEETAFLRDTFGAAWKSIEEGKFRSDAIENAPIVRTKTRLPVILFSPGLGMPSVAYSAQLEDLASHGYAVVAIDHPNDSPLLAFLMAL